MEVVHCPPPFLSCPWSPRARVARRQCLRCGAAEASGAAAMETSLRSGRGVAAAAFARQQCLRCLGSRGLWVLRFRRLAPQRWKPRYAEIGGRAAVRAPVGYAVNAQNLRRHNASKTCFDRLNLCRPSRSSGVPAGSEMSSCVPVHATRPTERRRVHTRRTARGETQAASRTQRPFFFVERAVAVERTNDA